MTKKVTFIKQLGIGLLELMLSLAIIAILLIMATRYYQSASNNNSINSAVDMANGVKSAVKNYMNSNMNTSTLPTVAQLVAGGYLPQAYSNASTASPWGGEVCVVGSTAGSTTAATACSGTSTVGATFNVVITGIPAAATCTQLVNRLQSTLNTAAGESAACAGDNSAVGVLYAS